MEKGGGEVARRLEALEEAGLEIGWTLHCTKGTKPCNNFSIGKESPVCLGLEEQGFQESGALEDLGSNPYRNKLSW